ncbi:response regulator [Microvirga vignae]|uniref:response regulator n=1 Tax=Microvirga vignae TaxID=1225564 RepID=UPI000699C2EB|nr:response regulator [Microvirga vignae]
MRAAAIYHDFVDAGLDELGVSNASAEGIITRHPPRECILIIETDAAFRNSIAQVLWETGYEVLTTTTGEQAFRLLRDWRQPIDWLYSQATLPGLIDGWILADQHHDNHPDRSVVIGAREARLSARGDVVLNEPPPAATLDAVRYVTTSARSQEPLDPAGATRRASPHGILGGPSERADCLA